MSKSVAATLDVAAIQAHLERYAISCPLCRSMEGMLIAREPCELKGGNGEPFAVVVVVCKRCGYVIPLAAEAVSSGSAL